MEEKSKEEKIKIIMKQTSYSESESYEKLDQFKGNVENVILDYMGGSNVKVRSTTNNQKIFKAMRELY
tara:strand:- start:105 stop:308 length:204 start_codon:yes stop_codon:yes gene_type:complete